MLKGGEVSLVSYDEYLHSDTIAPLLTCRYDI